MKYLITAISGAVLLVLALMMFNCGREADIPADSAAASAAAGAGEAQTAMLKLAVKGMTCQGCVTTIQGALSKTDGVRPGSVVVSLADSSATLAYDPTRVNEADLIGVIKKAGYSASLAANQ